MGGLPFRALGPGRKGESCASGDPCCSDIKKPYKLLVKFRAEPGRCKVTDPFLAGAFPTQELFPRKLHLLGKEATPSESWVGVGLLGRLPVCLCGSLLNFSHGFVSRPLLQFRRWTCPFRSILWSCTWELCLPVARGTTQTIPRAFAIAIRGRPS